MHAKFYVDQPNVKCLLQLTISIRKQCLPRKISVIRAGAWNFLCCRRTMRTADVSVSSSCSTAIVSFFDFTSSSPFSLFIPPLTVTVGARSVKAGRSNPSTLDCMNSGRVLFLTTDISHVHKLGPVTEMGRQVYNNVTCLASSFDQCAHRRPTLVNFHKL